MTHTCFSEVVSLYTGKIMKKTGLCSGTAELNEIFGHSIPVALYAHPPMKTTLDSLCQATLKDQSSRSSETVARM